MYECRLESIGHVSPLGQSHEEELVHADLESPERDSPDWPESFRKTSIHLSMTFSRQFQQTSLGV